MSFRVIAGRYARGLSESIAEPAALDLAVQQLHAFVELYTGESDLRTVLDNPAIPPAQRQKVLEDLSERLDQLPAVRRTLALLQQRGRLSLAVHVADAFERLADRRSNRTTARVSSAAPLSDAQQQKLSEGLAALAGKDVRLDTSVNPGLGGGVVVNLDGKVLDGSLKTRLERIKHALLAQ